MKKHPFSSPTPEEQRRLSNFGHTVEGLLLGVVGILILYARYSTVPWAASTWPVLIFIAGLLLLILIYFRHPMSHWPHIWQDPQQREHTVIAAAGSLSGLAERFRESMPVLGLIWPVALLAIGSLFLFHVQHGTSKAAARAVRQHQILGITIIAAGCLRLAELLGENAAFSILWPLAVLAAAGQLLAYREPEGAYEAENRHKGHG